MSNELPPPTKPKPGSLRDRIAAFENKNAPAASAPGPGAGVAAPVPRPKPGNLQWKPKPPSPPPTIPDQASKIAGVGGGMSASDAKESISRGGTLRERMAALQGKGGFGAPAPPPVKPVAVEKPKWKPPPVVSPPPVDDEGVPGRASSQSPPYRRSTSPPSDALTKTRSSPPPEGDRTSPDPEEEERERRAAIAARMARLGGARIGMAPPIVAPKPVARKPTAPAPEPKQEESNVEASANLPSDAAVETLSRELVGSPSKEETTEESTPPVERRDSDQASIGSPSSNRTPAAMPVPAGPRRAAPPRRKTYKSAPSTQLPEVPVPVSGSDQSVSEPTAAASPPPLAEASNVESSQQLVVTPPVGALIAGEAHYEVGIVNQPADVLDDTLLSGEDGTGTVLVERLDTIVNEPEGDVDEEGYTQELQVRGQGSLVGSSSNMTADDEHGYVPSDRKPSSHVHVELEPEQEKELEVEQGQDEDEEDDETRRKRVAARLAQMGAFNPLTGPPPIPRRTSIEEPHSEENQFDVEEEVSVDTEEVGEYVPSPPTAAAPPAAHQVEEEFERGHVTAEVEERNVEADVEKIEGEGEAVNAVHVERNVSDEHEVEFESTTTAGDRVTHRVLYHNTGIDDDDEEGQQHVSLPPLSHEAGRLSLEERTAQAIADQLFDDSYSNGADLGEPLASTAEAELGAEGQAPASQADINSRGSVPSTRPENKPALETRANDDDDDGYVTGAGKGEDDDMAPPRITRPIPPPPVNFGTKPLLVSPSAPSRTALQSLKDDEQDRAVSPDIPPRPIPPPPVRSVPEVVEGELPIQPRRSMPPPPRRSSLKMTEPAIETPPTPPPVPTLLRPTRRPTSPPIITTLPVLVSERVGGSEEPEASASESQETQGQELENDDKAARRRAIAERMARLGGIRFGAPAPMHHLSRPPMPPAPPPTSIPHDDSESEVKEDDVQPDEDEDEAARKERVMARIAAIGGIRFGDHPPAAALPPASARHLVSKQEDSESEDATLPVPVPPPQRAPSIRRPPPPFDVESEQSSLRTSEEGVEVEAEESEPEEVLYSDKDIYSGEEGMPPPPLPPARRVATKSAPIDALPRPPPRSPPMRPPVPGVPASLLNRRASTTAGSVASSRKSSMDYSTNTDMPIASSRTRTSQELVSQSEYVMVEPEPEGEETPVPPPRRPTRVPSRSVPLPPPPPPSAIDPPEDLASSNQWELPSIPQGAEFIADSDLGSSGWSDDSTAVHFHPPPPPPQAPALSNPASCSPTKQAASSSRRSTSSIDQQQVVSAEELMVVWGKIGVQVVEAASDLFEKSKRSLVGDGSYPGFVRAVLAQVPEALQSSDPEECGYVIYAQTGATVQRRVADIMPGDVIMFRDAKLKGHKNLHAYSQAVGMGEGGALVGIVHEFEAKKSKVRVWQANQHVGQQSVEIVSYRLEDLKSGQVKIFRVLEKAT